jgi:hypothetical protein
MLKFVASELAEVYRGVQIQKSKLKTQAQDELYKLWHPRKGVSLMA